MAVLSAEYKKLNKRLDSAGTSLFPFFALAETSEKRPSES